MRRYISVVKATICGTLLLRAWQTNTGGVEDKVRPPQDEPLRRKVYFELKTVKTQQIWGKLCIYPTNCLKGIKIEDLLIFPDCFWDFHICVDSLFVQK